MRDPRRCALDPLLHAVPGAPDPVEPAVLAAHEASRGRYGARKIKAALSRDGITASRRRICRIMRKNGLNSAYGGKRFKCRPDRPNEADLPNVVAREFGGRAPCTHVCSDLTYVRVGGDWNMPWPGPIHKDSTHDAVRFGCYLGRHARMLHIFPLLPLDKIKVLRFYDFALILPMVSSCYQQYSVSPSEGKLIPNSALFIYHFVSFTPGF